MVRYYLTILTVTLNNMLKERLDEQSAHIIEVKNKFCDKLDLEKSPLPSFEEIMESLKLPLLDIYLNMGSGQYYSTNVITNSQSKSIRLTIVKSDNSRVTNPVSEDVSLVATWIDQNIKVGQFIRWDNQVLLANGYLVNTIYELGCDQFNQVNLVDNLKSRNGCFFKSTTVSGTTLLNIKYAAPGDIMVAKYGITIDGFEQYSKLVSQQKIPIYFLKQTGMENI